MSEFELTTALSVSSNRMWFDQGLYRQCLCATLLMKEARLKLGRPNRMCGIKEGEAAAWHVRV
jgi:hypothetical protein